MPRELKRYGTVASFGMLLAWLAVIAVGLSALRAGGFRFRSEDRVGSGRAADEGPGAADARVSGHGASVFAERAETGTTSGPPGRRNAPDEFRGADRAPGDEEEGDVARPGIVDAGVIDFETYPDGRPACDSCPLSDEFRSLGVVFSFRSWSATGQYPSLVDAGSYLPEGTEGPHGVGPALQERGMEVGVIRMDFPGAPMKVDFDLTGPELIDRFQITAWTSGDRIESSAIHRSGSRTFHASGGGVFRRERVTIESAAGIDRVELDGWGPPGYLMLVDDLVIGLRSAASRSDAR